MKIVYIMAAIYGADLTVTKHDTEAACRAALVALPAFVGGECVAIEVLVESSPYAPILAPRPPRKP